MSVCKVPRPLSPIDIPHIFNISDPGGEQASMLPRQKAGLWEKEEDALHKSPNNHLQKGLRHNVDNHVSDFQIIHHQLNCDHHHILNMIIRKNIIMHDDKHHQRSLSNVAWQYCCAMKLDRSQTHIKSFIINKHHHRFPSNVAWEYQPHPSWCRSPGLSVGWSQKFIHFILYTLYHFLKNCDQPFCHPQFFTST